MKKKIDAKWNVLFWNVNLNRLEEYDVIPRFVDAIKSIKKNERPKTVEELDEVLKSEARYMFWAKCEYELLIKSWPEGKNDEKIDIYHQLKLNWDVFVRYFWDNVMVGV